MTPDTSAIGALERIATRANATGPGEGLQPRLPTIFEDPAGRPAPPDEATAEAPADGTERRAAAPISRPAVLHADLGSPTGSPAPFPDPARRPAPSAADVDVDVFDGPAPTAPPVPVRASRAAAPEPARAGHESATPVGRREASVSRTPAPTSLAREEPAVPAAHHGREPQARADGGVRAPVTAAVPTAPIPAPVARERVASPPFRPLSRIEPPRAPRRDSALDEGTTVRVTIGRVEIRAVAPHVAASPAPPRARPATPSGLDAYLGRRNRGARS